MFPSPRSLLPAALSGYEDADRTLTKDEALKGYVEHYRALAKTHPESLRVKLKRSQLQQFLDEIGEHVAKLARDIGGENPPKTDHAKAVRQFLEDNPIPGDIGRYLSLELRAYALLVHAVHQWSVGQQLTADRWVVSGNARDTLRACTDRCVVTDELFADGKIELHHPARDGRPPIPVSSKGHKIADDVFDPQDDLGKSLVAVRRRLRYAWSVIWQGCMVELDQPVSFATYKNPKTRERAVVSRARRFAREAGVEVASIRRWIEENDLVETDDALEEAETTAAEAVS